MAEGAESVPGVVQVTGASALPDPPQVGDKNAAPTTTASQDLITAGQRRVNLIWEVMQAFIAATVTGTALYVSSRLSLAALVPEATEKQMLFANISFLLISNMFSLVVGFYFGRTNHQKIGGVKSNDTGR